jgi:hypothetical protein
MADATSWESLSLEDLLKLVKKYGSRNKAAESLGVAKSTFKDHMKKLEQASLTHRAVVKPVKIAKPRSGVKRFILTSAQDSTKVHMPFLNNLLAYADHFLNCEVLIGGFTYNKSLFEDHDKNGKSVYFDKAVEPYLTNDRTVLGDRAVFCGEFNRLPTAATPLTGYRAYTQDKWGIFPHAKYHLESVPRVKGDPVKVIQTTGCVTLPNYIPKSAGIKAEFYHTYGAVLVEIAADGAFFARPLFGDKDDGSFYDLDRYVSDGKVIENINVKAVTLGDIHLRQLNQICAETVWGMDFPTMRSSFGKNTVIGRLNPSYQFVHDLDDFHPRNHHNIDDPHHLYKMLINGEESVREEVEECGSFLHSISETGCRAIVVNSNHDEALRKWLKTADYRKDPVNAEFFLECQLDYYREIKEGNTRPLIFERAVRRSVPWTDLSHVQFLDIDESFRLGDVEYGMHGHLGINGRQASPRTMSSVGPKAVGAHSHSPCVYDGYWVTGVLGNLDMGYNMGMTSWAHANILTYNNDKHAHIFMDKGRWWA